MKILKKLMFYIMNVADNFEIGLWINKENKNLINL